MIKQAKLEKYEDKENFSKENEIENFKEKPNILKNEDFEPLKVFLKENPANIYGTSKK